MRLAALLIGLGCSVAAEAHDFWIQPAQYWAQPDAAIPFTLQVGHGAERQRSQIRSNRIASLLAVTPDQTTIDVRGQLHLRGAHDDGRLKFEEPGTYLVVLQTDDRGRSTLPAPRFNEYARAEGLTDALKQRQQTDRMASAATESYRRVSKAIIQIGLIDTARQAHVVTPLGLPLEIVPERSPYAEAQRGDLPVRVFFEGQPLAGALVKLTSLEKDDAPLQAHRTDPSGRATFSLRPQGAWILNVIWTKRAAAAAEVDFETTFSSLSFGFATEPIPAAP